MVRVNGADGLIVEHANLADLGMDMGQPGVIIGGRFVMGNHTERSQKKPPPNKFGFVSDTGFLV